MAEVETNKILHIFIQFIQKQKSPNGNVFQVKFFFKKREIS